MSRLGHSWLLLLQELSGSVPLACFLEAQVSRWRLLRPAVMSALSRKGWALVLGLGRPGRGLDCSIRINCGGARYEDAKGIVWERDRFFTQGYPYSGGKFTGAIHNTEDDPLYQTERFFSPLGLGPHGYGIPLAPGTYRVTLHFAEIAYSLPERRSFDVLLEGNRVLERFDPSAEAGPARAQSSSHEVTIEDGLLESGIVRFEYLDQKLAHQRAQTRYQCARDLCLRNRLETE